MRGTGTTIRNAIVGMALSALACVGARAGEPGGAPVFEGPITAESVDAFIAGLDEAKPAARWVILDSQGGDVDAALKLAEVLHARSMSVYVRKLCASSCANYLFLAGRSKVIGAGAVVGWHGSPASEHIDGLESLSAAQRRDFEKMRRALIARERRFLAEVRVDRRLLCVGDRTIAQAHATGWTMPVRAMARFGVNDVAAEPGAAIPTHVPNHSEPVLVLDPEPDCGRVYPPLADARY